MSAGVVQLRPVSRASGRVRHAALVGAVPGTVFVAAAAFVPGSESVYLNGQRQESPLCYSLGESGGVGTGFDEVTFTFTIIGTDTLSIDYDPA